MPATVHFGGERVEILADDDDRLIAQWHGPPGLEAEEIERQVRAALESPLDFPAIALAMVPGDRIALAFDPLTPGSIRILNVLAQIMDAAGVERGDVTLLTPTVPPPGWIDAVPPGMQLVSHTPEDRDTLAYLATTEAGRRVYLNRIAIDADLLISVGRVGFDAVMRLSGPWSVLYPGLGDAEAQASIRRSARGTDESAEVAWLVGNQFQMGVIEGQSGLLAVLGGMAAAVRSEAERINTEAWTLRVDRRADLVIAGVGNSDQTTTLDDLAAALDAAVGVVRRGGKIVLLSRAEGEPGPAVQRLLGLDDPRHGIASLKGAESSSDYATAASLARGLAWADVYVLSRLPENLADDLGMIPLARPEEALRLAKTSPSYLVISHAERTRTLTTETPES